MKECSFKGSICLKKLTLVFQESKYPLNTFVCLTLIYYCVQVAWLTQILPLFSPQLFTHLPCMEMKIHKVIIVRRSYFQLDNGRLEPGKLFEKQGKNSQIIVQQILEHEKVELVYSKVLLVLSIDIKLACCFPCLRTTFFSTIFKQLDDMFF